MFFHKYENNKKLNKKYVDNIQKQMDDEYFDEEKPSFVDKEQQIEDTLENLSKVKEKVKQEILKEDIEANPFFDEQLFNHLDNLHSYIKGYIPNYPKYYNSDRKINPKAFLDARDIIKNELPLNAEEILNTPTSMSGVTNDTKMNFENGYQVDFEGNIYNPKKEIIFNPNSPSEKIKFIDLLNKKVVTENGIRIDLPDNFINEFIKNNEYLDQEFKDKLTELTNKIEQNSSSSSDTSDKFNASNTIIVDNIYATINGVPITYEDKIFVEMELDDIYTGDIFGENNKIDIIGQIEKYNISEPSLGICNFKDIPYAELNSKLFWGGGQRGVRPLASNDISDKDISFAPNGTVYYSGSNSTVSIHRAGCRSKTYKTGHVCMWSSSNKTGLKTSIIQYIYKFCNMFGLFNANIPPLIGYKKFKIFPGLCIGGLVEMALMGWQERISQRINEMFQCIPSKMPTDDTKSLFENATFQYGSSVNNLEDLDKIKACKFGDRYVVDIVSSNITGLGKEACGVFVFDPNDKLANAYKWKYKTWRGKPFNPKDNNTIIQDFGNMYENPLIQDLLMNTNALGEDSITRKLMSLQYAYMKKQSLLSISDVEVSLDAIIEQSIYGILDQLTYKIANYIQLLDYKENQSNVNSDDADIPSYGTPISFANMFLNTYSYLTDNGILKSCPLDKCLREIKKTVAGSGGGGSSPSTITIRFYDFTGYNPNEYLVPSYNNISMADCMAFSAMHVPSDELKGVFENNLKYLDKLGAKNNFTDVTTIRDFINASDNKAAFEKNIEDNLKYIEYELSYSGYDSRVNEQIRKRCSYTINSKNIF